MNGTSREQSKNSKNNDSGPEVYSKTSLKLIMAKIQSSTVFFGFFNGWSLFFFFITPYILI